MKRAFPILFLLLLVGCPKPVPPTPPTPPVPPTPPPVVLADSVYVVIESSSLRDQPEAVVLWLNSQQLKDDLRAKGIKFYRVDPDVINKKGGQVPAELKPILDVAKPPCVVIADKAGKLSTVALPSDEPAARKVFGL